MLVGTPLLLCFAASIAIYLLWSWCENRKRNPKSLPLPPGPKPMPLFGNVGDLPETQAWLKVAEWKKVHGMALLIHCKCFELTPPGIKAISFVYMHSGIIPSS